MACSRHDNLPCSPSDSSRNDVWKVEGVSTFSLGMFVRGHGIHIYPPVLVVIELELHQNSKVTEPYTRVTTRLVDIQTSSGDSLTLGSLYTPLDKMDKTA